MVERGISPSFKLVTSLEIYDSAIDSWYYRGYLPEEPDYTDHDLITWVGNPVWLNNEKFWTFE